MFNTIDTLDATGKAIILRGDLNVPVKDGAVSDNTRLERLKPTINALTEKGAKVVVASHFGRPKGEKNPEMSLSAVATELAKVLGQDVKFIDDCIGENVASEVANLNNGDVAVLENLRFYKGEEANDTDFAKQLANGFDVYVNDAFSVSHRAHASTHAIANELPAYAGLNMQAELEALSSSLDNPARPVMAIVGGSKVSTKLDVLNNLVKKVDKLVIGGGMANTFLYATGVDIGASLCEKDLSETVKQIIATAELNDCDIILPNDAQVSDDINNGANSTEKQISDISETDMILDIGATATAQVVNEIKQCKTLIWNGPVGAFE
ncbi:MAG: phosphoglycerate kinase, partial [Alphaproteobacteria bacterium]